MLCDSTIEDIHLSTGIKDRIERIEYYDTHFLTDGISD